MQKKDYSDDGIEIENGLLQCEFLLDLRYKGQEHTVKVPLAFFPDGSVDITSSLNAFHAAHEKHFTFRLDNDVQIVNFHLVAKIEVRKPDLAPRVINGRSPEDTFLGYRDVDFDQHGVHKTAIHNGLEMEPGMTFTGPIIIQEPSVTLVVSPDHHNPLRYHL